MSWTVYAALIGWLPTTLLFFAFSSSRNAAFLSLIFGQLLLPEASFQVAGWLDLGKPMAVGLALLAATLVFDAGRLFGFRPRWFDLPMMVWCLVPLASSYTNGLGFYDGFSGVQHLLWRYCVPYLIGRIYVRRLDDLVAFSRCLAVGGLLYLPLCWFEIRFSPQLHTLVYGFHQHGFLQTIRFGGWRPTVFLQHGLAVGMWMCAATTATYGLFKGGAQQRVAGIPIAVLLIALGATCLACKSVGSILLLALGLLVLAVTVRHRTPRAVLLLALLMPCYLMSRTLFGWDAAYLVAQVGNYSRDRAESLSVRLAADAVLRDRALERPLFGWGGWNRFREGLPPLPSDSLWAITLGQRGLVGLCSLFGMMFLAQVLPLWRLRRARLALHRWPELASLAAVLGLYALDSMANAMPSLIYIALAGGLIGWRPPDPVHTPGLSHRAVW